jgi:hypothetical protein
MARKTTVALEDDLDGGPADEAVRFGLGGSEYEIDLSAQNAAAFRRLAPFVEHARKAGRGRWQLSTRVCTEVRRRRPAFVSHGRPTWQVLYPGDPATDRPIQADPQQVGAASAR